METLTPPRELLVAEDLQRQTAHWLAAATTFLDAEEFAAEPAWRSLEQHIGLPLRSQLATIVRELITFGQHSQRLAGRAAHDPELLSEAQRSVQQFRQRYTQVELTLDFFGDAVNSRTSGPLRAALRTLDMLATASMDEVLAAARLPVPPALCYLDHGTGASILRAGIRLWTPGMLNPVAAIKIVRHNLYRPTSLFHESGHQVSHLTGWAPSLGTAIQNALSDDPRLQRMWQPWSSEIAADVYAFLHTGFASVAALYDVVGDTRTLTRWPIGDPHPIGWLRTLLGCALCRAVFGNGPWDRLEEAMLANYPSHRADPAVAPLLTSSAALIPRIANACLTAPVPALRGEPMARILDPERVSPSALAELERSSGAALWRSPHYRRTEGIRIVALAGLREAENPAAAAFWIDRARNWMTDWHAVKDGSWRK
jgi:hypothetical protein